MGPRIYLDHAATTPMLPTARAAVTDGMDRWANPSSPHAEGRAARAALEQARSRIKVALGWSGELILTSGASEAATLALGRRRIGQVQMAATEHDAVLRADPTAEIIPVTRDGQVDPAMIGAGALVAVQAANSETGVVQPLERIAARGAVWLADCAQTAGKATLPDADLIIVSAHKLGGPPGIGALLVRDLALLDPGGGQEQGYRGGTENLPGALGFAAAVEAPRDWLELMASLRAGLDDAIVAAGGEIVAAGAPRMPTIAAYRMPGLSAQAQLIRLDLAGFAVSAGSACSSGTMKPSHVLSAMGWDKAAAGEVIRVSFGWTTTEDDVARFAAAWRELAAGGRRAA